MYETPDKTIPFENSSETAESESQNSDVQRLRIQTLNDCLRSTFIGGVVTINANVLSLGGAELMRVLGAIQRFDSFSKDNDPHGEHDYGVIETDAGYENVCWKIDYYTNDLKAGSEDPADPRVTARVLTIMFVSDY